VNFKQLDISHEYRSFQDDIINDFYIPVLKNATVYKRAVGYFSSSALFEVSKGIGNFIKNDGKIKIIASPQLSKEDVKAINKGYENRDNIIEQSILSSLDYEPDNYFEKERLNLLAHLVADGTLDLKIAFIEAKNGIGIYHEKVGILEDDSANKIVFSGSLNETKTALSYNYESIDVFCSWKGDGERISSKERAFDNLWKNEELKVKTIKFPEVAKEKLMTYKYKEPNLEIDKEEYQQQNNISIIKEGKIKEKGPRLPEVNNFKLRDYQNEAIENWVEDDYQGIFSMATGTGKTITALGAATRLFNDNNKQLAIIIVCPYQHLVEQWVEDIKFFGMDPIIGYSASEQRNWRRILRRNVDNYNYEITDHFCFVTTNATFGSKYVQDRLKRLQKNFLIIIDEAHNFGAEHLSKSLLTNAKYRLALSATIERHMDEEGTQKLFSYFNTVSFEYSLEEAIRNGMLTPYEYYPIPVHLTDNELEEYKRLTHEISKRLYKDKLGKVKFRDSAKYFLIQRARLVAGAQNKIKALEKAITKSTGEDNILVYCGATTINDTDYSEGNPEEEEIRQIDVVTDLLGNKLGMHVAQFTSRESMKEREVLIDRLANNEKLQALIAIRCLDEGVDIPSIKTAYILASSTNPKEYIQRRGRVLRKHKDKTKAVIYDFITLPAPIEQMNTLTDDEIDSYKGLIHREVLRMQDFVSLSMNPSAADFLIFDLEKHFNLWEGGAEIESIV